GNNADLHSCDEEARAGGEESTGWLSVEVRSKRQCGELENGMTHPPSNIQHRTSNIEHPTSNIQHPTSNIQHPTSNIQHPTSNIQHRTSKASQQGATH